MALTNPLVTFNYDYDGWGWSESHYHVDDASPASVLDDAVKLAKARALLLASKVKVGEIKVSYDNLAGDSWRKGGTGITQPTKSGQADVDFPGDGLMVRCYGPAASGFRKQFYLGGIPYGLNIPAKVGDWSTAWWANFNLFLTLLTRQGNPSLNPVWGYKATVKTGGLGGRLGITNVINNTTSLTIQCSAPHGFLVGNQIRIRKLYYTPPAGVSGKWIVMGVGVPDNKSFVIGETVPLPSNFVKRDDGTLGTVELPQQVFVPYSGGKYIRPAPRKRGKGSYGPTGRKKTRRRGS